MVFWAESIHLFLSTLVLVVLGLAGFQALLLIAQHRMLKTKQTSYFIRYFPPIEMMETYLFFLIFIAICVLTLVLISSLILFKPILLHHMWQKMLLSIIAWCVLLMLLIGRLCLGWRGKVAIYWTFVGVGLIAAIYLGTMVIHANTLK